MRVVSSTKIDISDKVQKVSCDCILISMCAIVLNQIFASVSASIIKPAAKDERGRKEADKERHRGKQVTTLLI